MSRTLLISTEALGICAVLVTAIPAESIDFSRDIRPILSNNCFQCHGPDQSQRQAGLRLDIRDGAVVELDSGALAIVPGEPAASELIRRIFSKEPRERMPPPYSKKSLSTEERTRIRAWIAAGAQFTPHWSFRPLRRSALPELEHTSWCRNEIDLFVLQRLRQEGLAPSQDADRRTLIRRVSFDLTGLPPTIDEVDAFLADASPAAYERVVDRLLASPRYGERMAVDWLDLARYADTDGYEKDSHRQMWPYRDWVIHAFNSNMPFDQFTIAQLAGDLLDNSTLSQKVASAFNRNNPTTSEAGSDPKEYAAKYAVDRVTTTSIVWLGLTMQCAECHDHKFDPLPTRDFYRMFAFFNQLPEIPLYEGADSPPSLRIPSPEHRDTFRRLKQQHADLQRRREETRQRLIAQRHVLLDQWRDETRTRIQPREALILEYAFEESDGIECYDSSGAKRHAVFQTAEHVGGTAVSRSNGLLGGGLRFDGRGWVACTKSLPVPSNGGFSYGAWVRPTAHGGVVISKNDPQRGSRGFDLYMQAGKAIVHLIDSWPDAALKVTTATNYTPDQWVHVLVTWNGGKSAESLAVYFDGVPQQLEVVLNNPLVTDIQVGSPLRIGSRAAGESALHGAVDEVRIYDRPLSESQALGIVGDTVNRLLQSASLSELQPEVQRIVEDYFERSVVAHAVADLDQQLADLEHAITQLEKDRPAVRIMQDSVERKPTYILRRGNFRDEGEEVTAGIPGVLGSITQVQPINRLTLAQWLVSDENPLTARVTVNRLWAMCFGTGIVRTANDFGSQGQWPSHPELLDWLAASFRNDGWNVQAVLKQIVTSSTYRQSSVASPELAARDPANRLLARGPRHRLSAEMIRDQTLHIAGLLHDEIGGPSVFPYHPPGLWEEMAWADSPWKTWQQDHGKDLYRRGLYTFWKRSLLHPVLSLFDAPARDVCSVDRPLTNTPLQALTTLNETSFVEAARTFAERILRGGRNDTAARVDYAYQLALARSPTTAERESVVLLYRKMHAIYEEHSQKAIKLLSVGESPRPEELDPAEQAAWTCVGQVILNLDETLTKE